MSKERLERIKNLPTHTSFATTRATLDKGDLDWLIKQAERAQELEELQSKKMNLIRTIDNLRNEKRDLQEQNKHYHNLLKSISDTHDLAEEIQKENPDIKVITPDDLLQHILRKVNDELERDEG